MWLFCNWSSRLLCVVFFFFFQAEDGIRDLVRSRGLGDVYKRQVHTYSGYENKVKTNLEKRVDNMNMGDKIFRVVVPLSLIHI